MPIDNGTWHTRVGVFYSLKPLFKTKSIIKEILAFLLHHTSYFLASILDYLVTTQLNHLQCIFSCIINKILMLENLCLLKIANIILLSMFIFENLLSQSGNIFERLSFGEKK